MPKTKTIVLSGGGIRSVTALGRQVDSDSARQIAVLYVRDGRPNAGVRWEYVRKQADHYRVPTLIELEMPCLRQSGPGATAEGLATLARAQILAAAMGRAIELGAERLVWPSQVGPQHEAVARRSELAILARHIAELEHDEAPPVSLPLLELTDREVIELAGQMDVPLELAWSCLLSRSEPCGACDGCRRRKQAFDQAGIVDPQIEGVGARKD